MKINKFEINGTELNIQEETHGSDSFCKLSRSFKIEAPNRDKTNTHSIKLSDNDVVEFIFDDDTVWLSNANTIAEIFPDQKNKTRDGETLFTIPHEISAETGERGIIKKAILKIVNILAKKTVQLSVKKLAGELEKKQLENRIGLFRLSPDFQLLDYSAKSSEQPFCLLIHGTASSTSGSFKDINEWGLMDYLLENYNEHILAFQHRTLTENPLQNVKELVKQLPQKCKLHIISTSRGGLVGEILSRFCNSAGNQKGFTTAELLVLKKEYPEKYYNELIATINEIETEITSKRIIIEKFIRVACPAAGTTLASKRLDNFFNITFNLIGLGTGLAANPIFAATRNLLLAVIDSKNNEEALPGIEVQRPNSPFIKVLNGWQIAEQILIDNSLAIIAGNSTIGFKLNALLIIASKILFKQDNDLVVDSISMPLGSKRTGKVQEFFNEGKDINHFKYFENKKTNKAIMLALKSKWGETLPGFTTNPVELSAYRDFDLANTEIENPLLWYKRKHRRKAANLPPINISISQGDLQYAKYPILAGHFANDSILYAEKRIDLLLNGRLCKFKELGNYPARIKDSRMFFQNTKKFKGAIILGLGKLEKLTPSELSKTVEMGVANFLFNLQDNDVLFDSMKNKDQQIGISSLIIGCGYGGLVIENSIRAIIQGVYGANLRIKELHPETSRLVQKLEFVEIFEDKALNSLIALNNIEHDESNSFKISTEDRKHIFTLPGAKKRIPLDASSEWWNRITVIENDEPDKTRELQFSTATRSARVEQQKLFTSPLLLEETIKEISTNMNWTPERAKTIFEMLVPNDFKDELKRHGNIIWVLDSYSATYPWELLQDGVENTKPICVSSGMIRQLNTSDYRKTIKTAAQDNALIVADPDLKGFIGQLKGALKEGKKVAQVLEENGFSVSDSYNENHSDILEKLFCNDYKIIHLSGHGVFHNDTSKGSGMVIGKDLYLSTREIQQMSTVPEFVFVNCCHLGKTDGAAEEFYQQRFKLAANIGTQLINNGVKCVIAAGWAVNDDAALDFAEIFYAKMIAGSTFGAAVKEARKTVYKLYRDSNNTWGAYQAYGDPFYRFRQQNKHKTSKSYLHAQEAEVDLENLLSAIEIGNLTSDNYEKQLEVISEAVEQANILKPRILELEALICIELRNYDKACSTFKQLMNSGENTFLFSTIEKFHNAKAKKIVETYKKDKETRSVDIADIDKIIADMRTLLQISLAPERINILGSTYKRKAYLSTKKTEKLKAYQQAAYFYRNGYYEFNAWYSLTNWLTFESIFYLAGKRKWSDQVNIEDGYKLLSFSAANRALTKLEKAIPADIESMNYWQMISTIQIRLCRFILSYHKKNDQKNIDEIYEQISELWKIAGSKGRRFAEIEHLEFILDALSIVQNRITKKLSVTIENLKSKLEELLTDSATV